MIALVLAEGEEIAEGVIYCLYQGGINSLVIGPESSKTLILSKGCQKFFPIKYGTYVSSPMKLVNLINFVACKFNPLVVVPTGSDSIEFLSSYKDQVSSPVFPVPPIDVFDNLNNKWKFSRLLKKLGLPQPATCLLEEISSLKSLEFSHPIISKQLCGSSGEDIYYLHSKGDLLAFIKSCDEKLFPMIIQEYIPGYDIDLSVLSVDGQIAAWAIQRLVGKGILEFIDEPGILSLGQQLIHETKFSGVAHFDLRYDNRDGCFKFIECNPRFWGSLKASCHCGVNFPCIGLQHVLKLQPSISLNQSPQDNLWMNFSALLRSFKSWGTLRKVTLPVFRHSFKDIVKLWYFNYEVNKFSPKTSHMLVSLYDKLTKKIYNQEEAARQT